MVSRCSLRFGRRNAGLTLLELVVVLTVLVAIGALVVPMLPNMIHRSNIASCVVNITEMDKLMQTYSNLYAEFPDRLDNLVKADGNLASYVAAGSYGDPPAPSFAAASLTAEEATSLTAGGIKNLCTLVEDAGGDWKPTFWPYNAALNSTPTLTPVDANLKTAVLTATGAQLMGLPYSTNYKYVIFGANAPSTLFRNLAAEPAYHFADTPKEDPATYYMCLGVVFAVKIEADTAAGGKTSKVPAQAKYMGCAAFHDFGLSTAGMHTKEWWERLKSERPMK